MHYCIVNGKQVYDCDHSKCHNNVETRSGNRSGLVYCQVSKRWVYSCDHAACG